MANVPASGPVVLVANHLSLVDPAILGAVFQRPIRFMAKEEVFRTPFVSWLVRGFRAFPVRRGQADRQAMLITLRLLRQGEVVGIFPEGHRSHGDGLLPAHPGAALIALRAGAPVLPVGIAGTEQIFRWPRKCLRPAVTINVGKPFSLAASRDGSTREVLAGQADEIMRHVAELVPERYRGSYGATGDEPASLR